ncbi:hypothetical protein B296_00000170 [Ensete ventricosum]|uniref:Uncharacterized protein n=1 Tax=Ensete ventricosum TaxID=4639 RepID=A0A426Z404_ENSVE|nr:hypothetical protein B296_00000170 [Ensete ventricosum]
MPCRVDKGKQYRVCWLTFRVALPSPLHQQIRSKIMASSQGDSRHHRSSKLKDYGRFSQGHRHHSRVVFPHRWTLEPEPCSSQRSEGGKRREEVDRDQYHKLDQKIELDQGQAQYQEKVSGFRARTVPIFYYLEKKQGKQRLVGSRARLINVQRSNFKSSSSVVDNSRCSYLKQKKERVLLASLTWKERMLPKLAANEAAAKDAKLALT